MKKHILASFVIAALSASAFALPQVSVEQLAAPVVAEDGADRVGVRALLRVRAAFVDETRGRSCLRCAAHRQERERGGERDGAASRRHAEVRNGGGVFVVADLASTNGTAR